MTMHSATAPILGDGITQPSFDLDSIAPIEPFQRFAEAPDFRGVPAKVFDVPETISAMGYGSHQFFRYYGKFPSLVGKEIVEQFAMPGYAILDNYSGSGTTQVEAQIGGYKSYGVDINPLAVLASNVKTSYFNAQELQKFYRVVVEQAHEESAPCFVPREMSASKLNKWFSAEAQTQLGRLRAAIDLLPSCSAKDFITVCFLAIVRRCSRAFDGEVRPHVNKDKKQQMPLTVFSRKFKEMVQGLHELNSLRPDGIKSKTVLGDNRLERTFQGFDRDVGLIVSHPPYLNSFNYLQVFSLEFAWAEGMEAIWQGWTPQEIRRLEQKAWPATNPEIVAGYYESVQQSTDTARQVLVPGGALAIVVGDATIRGELEPVHEKIWDSVADLGMEPCEMWYRTTHYGIGKYAYSHRADYHGVADKKDVIMFFRRPR